MSVDNPLLTIQFQIPFDRIRAEHVAPAMDQLIARSEAALSAIVAQTSPLTWHNTMEVFDTASESLDWAITVVRHIESVSTTPELRAVVNQVQPLVSAFYSSISLNGELYAALKQYAATPEAASLTGVKKRYLEKTLDGFRRAGAELKPVGKSRLAEIDVELAKLTMKFAENVLDATNEFELILDQESQLAGLPPSAVAAARQSAESKGITGWRFTLQAPSYSAVLTYLDDRSIREKMHRAFNSRATSGPKDNRAIIDGILSLRKEKAILLGFKDFADLVLADRMAKSGQAAWNFLDQVKQKSLPFFDKENLELEQFRARVVPEALEPMELWDISYYAEKLRHERYDFDEEALRPYFPLPQVLDGVFEITGKLFGIRVSERSGVPVWHEDVRFYEIHDNASGELLGAFYSDLYPRETKRGGAWMDAFITGRPTAMGKFSPHLGLICGNLTPPIGDKPGLLTHRDVETVFHEFGHLLHHCLTKVEVRGLAGTNVAWDFVELPSQILENWCWEQEALNLFARHYETGETIPTAIFQKVRSAKQYRAAGAQMRQVSFAASDLALHMFYEKATDHDPVSFSRSILAEYQPTRLPEGHSLITAFTHLFASPVGYGAGYYSYKWAELLDADAYTRFRADDVISTKVGAAFRHEILSKGNSEEPADLYRNFMGRDPDPDAMFVRSGLAS